MGQSRHHTEIPRSLLESDKQTGLIGEISPRRGSQRLANAPVIGRTATAGLTGFANTGASFVGSEGLGILAHTTHSRLTSTDCTALHPLGRMIS